MKTIKNTKMKSKRHKLDLSIQSNKCFFITIIMMLFYSLPLSATIQITSTQCICGENGEGSIEIEATGDAGPFTFEWVGPNGVIQEATEQNLTG